MSRLFSFVMVFWSHQCDFILLSGELFGGQPLWSHHLGQVAKVAGTCHLLHLLLPHHPPMLSDFGRGVHRDCSGEYCSAFSNKIESECGQQVSRKQLTLPSRLSRLSLVLVHTLGPAIFSSVLKLLEKKLRDPKFEISSAARQTLLNFIPLLSIFASGLQRLHACLFYLQVSSSRQSYSICPKSKQF